MSPDRLQPAPQEQVTTPTSYAQEFKSAIDEAKETFVPAIEAQVDDNDGAIKLPAELQAYVEAIFGRPMLCEAVSLQPDGFVIRMEEIKRPTHPYQDFVVVQPQDRQLPTGIDKELVFYAAGNSCTLGVYDPPSEFSFESQEERPLPFNVGAVGIALMQAVLARKDNKVVLHNATSDKPQEQRSTLRQAIEAGLRVGEIGELGPP